VCNCHLGKLSPGSLLATVSRKVAGQAFADLRPLCSVKGVRSREHTLIRRHLKCWNCNFPQLLPYPMLSESDGYFRYSVSLSQISTRRRQITTIPKRLPVPPSPGLSTVSTAPDSGNQWPWSPLNRPIPSVAAIQTPLGSPGYVPTKHPQIRVLREELTIVNLPISRIRPGSCIDISISAEGGLWLIFASIEVLARCRSVAGRAYYFRYGDKV
jgi:hypothetical protein